MNENIRPAIVNILRKLNPGYLSTPPGHNLPLPIYLPNILMQEQSRENIRR